MFSVAIDGRRLRALAIVLAVINVVLWFAAPWLRKAWDAVTGRTGPADELLLGTGVQELIVYFDPWLSRVVFPAVYTLGLVAIALLYRPTPLPEQQSPVANSGTKRVALLLLGFEAVWIFLIGFAILFRGWNWNLISPWGGGELQLVWPTSLSFSEVFYNVFLGHPGATWPWPLREAPGPLLLTGYFVVGLLAARNMAQRTRGVGTFWGSVAFLIYLLTPLSLRKLGVVGIAGSGVATSVLLPVLTAVVAVSYLTLRLVRKRPSPQTPTENMPLRRWIPLVLLVQVAALVPLKMSLYWLFDLRYFIATPEDFANI